MRPAASSAPSGAENPDFLDRLGGRLGELPEVRDSLRVTGHLLQFEVGGRRLVVFPDGRAIVHGSGDPAEARTLVSRYIGN